MFWDSQSGFTFDLNQDTDRAELLVITPPIAGHLDRSLYQKWMAIVEGELDNSTMTIVHPSQRAADSSEVRRLPALIAAWSQKAQDLQKEAHVFYFAFKHPRTPWYARVIAACAAGYLLSPVQIIPSFIPVIGFMDDLVVLVVGFKLMQRAISPEVMKECRERAEAAEVKRKAKDSSVTEVVVSITVAVLWLISAIAGSLLMTRYIRRR